MTMTMRVARPTNDLVRLARFYCEGLGFDVLGRFEDHDGFDGVMLGRSDAPYHLEFTHRRGHTAGGAPSDEHLLVFYIPDTVEWQAAVNTMVAAGYDPVPAGNPYWDRQGKTFEDPDGYRVVLQGAAWRA